MKFVMEEHVKHRLTGIVVILSIAVIFLPAMMKKSNQHFEDNVSVSLKLPPKPLQPKVVIPKQTAMLKMVKVAHVDLPSLNDEPYPPVIAKAESLSKTPKSVLVKLEMPLKSVIKTIEPKKLVVATKVVQTAKSVVAVKTAAPVKSIAKAGFNIKKGYGIQLASFAQESNAEYLVARLRKQGYVATYNKYQSKNGQLYKVVAGLVDKKDEAINLQKKLASNMQLKGYIVQTGVS